MDCRVCGSSRTTKNGHTPKGNQRYLCQDCRKSFVEVMDPRRLTQAERLMAQRLAAEGTAARCIARVLGKGRNAVTDFLKTRAKTPCSA